jgi:hypothetical protein
MSIIPPFKFRRENGRTKAPGQPIETTHAKAKYAMLRQHWRLAGTGETDGIARLRKLGAEPARGLIAACATLVEAIRLFGSEHKLWRRRQTTTVINVSHS